MNWEIGEIKQIKGEWYQCIESSDCPKCDLKGFNNCNIQYPCSVLGRKDGNEVIFKKLEKVGGPYEFQKRTIQTYKIYTEPFISVDMDFIWAYLKGSNTIDIIIKQDIEDMEEKNNGNTPLNVLTDKYVNGDICYDDFEKEVKALYSCKEEIKPTLKEFDLEAAKLGKPVCTRDGRKVRIICFDTKGSTHPIVALIEKDEKEVLSLYMLNGKKYEDEDEEEWKGDLMMLPEKKEGWVNICYEHDAPSHREASWVYDKEEEAIKVGKEHGSCYIATVRIEWEE